MRLYIGFDQVKLYFIWPDYQQTSKQWCPLLMMNGFIFSGHMHAFIDIQSRTLLHKSEKTLLKKCHKTKVLENDTFFIVIATHRAMWEKSRHSQNKPQSKIAPESIVYIPRTLQCDSEWASKWTLSPAIRKLYLFSPESKFKSLAEQQQTSGFVLHILETSLSCIWNFCSY